MQLAERLLASIPITGIPVKELRAMFSKIEPNRIDYAMSGHLQAGRIRLLDGVAFRPGLMSRDDQARAGLLAPPPKDDPPIHTLVQRLGLDRPERGGVPR